MIELRPITLLLGQNSSGKSTFLRALPLLRQSIRIRSNAPLLWYGDLVDFGSIREVKSSFAGEDDSVAVSFRFDWLNILNPYVYAATRRRLGDVELSIYLKEIDDLTRLCGVKIRVGDDVAELSLDSRAAINTLLVNGADYTRVLPKDRIQLSHTDLVPQMYVTADVKKEASQSLEPLYRALSISEHEIFATFSKWFDRRVSSGTIRTFARRLSYAPEVEFREKVKTAKLSLKSWPSVRDYLISGHAAPELARLRALYLIGGLSDILYSVSRTLTAAVSNLAYVGPSRATGERYYRHQELAIDQIDPQGQNLAMFLYSLAIPERDEFSTWLQEQIGYAVRVDRQGGHIQIELKEVGSPNFHNLADMGYGFSQILPVMAQIWGRNRAQTPERRAGSFVAIEQPELHLHPAYQARIADVMASAVTAGKRPGSQQMYFVVETHSEALVNRLGELIYKRALAPESVAIYLFHRLAKTDATEITKSTFDENGALKDWPLGFFSSRSAI